MTYRSRRLLAGVCSAAALCLVPAVAARASENLGVPIVAQSADSAFGGSVSEVDAGEAILTAMYVDSSGNAHIAYASKPNGDIDLCTIPAGGTACGSAQVLQTDGTTNDEAIQSLKYLPDGNGSAVLAVGLDELTDPEYPPFVSSPTSADRLWSETEVFQPGSSTGTGIGFVYDAGGEGGGDEIYVPDENGLEVVGQWSDYDYPPVGEAGPANAYEFESFNSPSTDDVGPDLLGVQAGQDFPGEWPAGITELPNGSIAVLAYDEPVSDYTNPNTSPVGMYVQPEGGGSFGHLQQLGISGPVETDFAPSAYTYLINAVSTNPGGGISTNPPEDLELYTFDGSSLRWLGTIGATDDNTSGNIFPEESEWDTMPPTYEDPSGDLYAAWFARGGVDACPLSGDSDDTDVADCLMYRVVGPGGVFGPKVVLSEDYGFGGGDDEIGDVEQIAANSNGAGWVLVWRYPGNSDNIELYAEPLSAAATVPTSPTVTGTVTAVPLTCTGNGSCSLTVTLDSPAFARLPADASRTANARVRADARRTIRDVVLARARIVVRGGGHRRLRLELSAAGKALLRRDHGRLTASLNVVQSLGLTKAPSLVYGGQVTLR